jgi:hypothetical protein
MKKNLTTIALLVVVVFAFTACGASGQDENLVGTWRWVADGAYTYVFNYDGTGERGFAETNQTFTWATDGDRLEISRDQAMRREIQDETWTFFFFFYTLHMVNTKQEGVEFTYEREATDNPEELVGLWAWEADELYIVTLNGDGTGMRGRGSEAENFTWATDDGGTRLNIIRDTAPAGLIRGEMWTFEITEYTLTLTSRQDYNAPTLVYTRTQ